MFVTCYYVVAALFTFNYKLTKKTDHSSIILCSVNRHTYYIMVGCE